jgi:tetratricopeptide (TPR) repeat protein
MEWNRVYRVYLCPMATPVHRVDKYIELAAWLSNDCENDEEALRWVERALQIEPLNVSGLIVKGCVLHNLERLSDALLCFDRAIELEPNAADAWAERAQLLCTMKEWEQSLKSVHTGMELLQTETWRESESYSSLGEIFYESAAQAFYALGKIDPCRQVVERGLQHFPENEILKLIQAKVTE